MNCRGEYSITESGKISLRFEIAVRATVVTSPVFQILSTRWQHRPQVLPKPKRHSVHPAFQGTPPQTGISGTYFKWKATSTASKGCPFPLECYRSLWVDRQRSSGLGKKTGTHLFIHSLIHSFNKYVLRSYCIPGTVKGIKQGRYCSHHCQSNANQTLVAYTK